MIFFNVSEARGQLLDKGLVYTLRREYTQTGPTIAVTGSTAHNTLLCHVEVSRILKVESAHGLYPYLDKSGFDDVDTWLSKASPRARTLYKVVRSQ